MTFIAVRCSHCQSDQIVKRGKTAENPALPLPEHPLCQGKIFCSTLQPRVLT